MYKNEEETQAIAALKEVALENLKEQRRARRWGIFFKFALMAYLLLLLGFTVIPMLSKQRSEADEFTAVVRINGAIADGNEASADKIVGSLRRAFKNDKTQGVILYINSPGGSPVQSGYINDEIRRLKAKHENIPVYAVVADICASGGYYIAVAADEIYANKASIVGSIGVRMDSFGFTGTMEKLGVERRLYTAGNNKGMLDPFLPEVPAEIEHIESMLEVTHQQFIDVVKQGRGERLQDNPDIFSGLFWTGETALDLGLIDGLGSPSYVAREVIGTEEMVDFTTRKDWIEQVTERFGLSVRTLLQEESQPQLNLY